MSRRKQKKLKLLVPKRACSSCPYRRDVPSGVWAADHYHVLKELDCRRTIKLPYPTKDGIVMLDTPNPSPGTFHCHQSNATGKPTVCRGWLSVERNSIGARLLQMDEMPTEDESDFYYSTGTEACEAGLKGIESPSPEARALVEKLIARGAGKWEDDDE